MTRRPAIDQKKRGKGPSDPQNPAVYGLCRTACLLAAVLAVPASAASQRARVALRVEGACPDRDELRAQLAAIADVVDAPAPRVWTLDVRGLDDGGVEMTLRDAAGGFVTRSLPADECSTLAVVVALIVERQIDELAAGRGLPPEAARTDPQPPAPRSPDRPSLAFRVELGTGARVLADPGVIVGGGGLSFGLSTAAGFRAMVGVRANTPWEVAAAGERLSFWQLVPTLYVGWALRPATEIDLVPRVRFEVAALRVEPDVPGADGAWRALTYLGAGLSLGWRADPHVELWVALDGLFNLNVERYRVEPSGEVARSSWASFDLTAGLAVSAFE